MFPFRFLFLCLVIVTPLKAQQVTLSEVNIDNDGYNDARVIGQDDEGFFVLQSNLSLDSKRDRIGFKTRKLKVAYYDGLLKPKWNIPALPARENGAMDQVVFAYGKLLLISSSESKNESTMEVWVRELDNHGNGPVPGNRVASFSYDRSSDLEKVRFIYSSDQQRAMVILKENLDHGKILLHVASLDSNLRPISSKNLSIEYTNAELAIEEYKISNSGNLAFLGFLNKKERDKDGDKKRISEYHLFSLKDGEEKISDLPVKTGEKSLNQAGLVIDNMHNLAVVMGFFSDLNSMTGTGIFYCSLDFSKNPSLEIKTHALEGNQHTQMIGERNNSNDNGISNYPIQKIILRNDGGAVVIAEAAYTSEYSYYDYFTQSLIRHTDYHFDNVIIVSVNKDCSVDWSAVIHKRQESTDDGGMFSSFCPLINSDEIMIIYNRDVERNQSVHASIITNRGEQREVEVVKNGEHLAMLPSWGKQISENELVIPVYQKKKLFLAKIIF